MPFRSKKQWRWAFSTGQDFARRWAHETPSFRGLPATKASAEDTGSGAATDAAPSQRKKMTPQERARHAALVRWKKANPLGARLADARAKLKAKKRAAGGKGKGKAAPKPKPEEEGKTPQEIANENRAKVAEELGVGKDLDGALARLKAGMGGAKDEANADKLVAMGLAKKDSTTGRYSLTPNGNKYFRAAEKGDTDGARAALGDAKDKAAGTAADAADKEKAAADPKAEKKKGGGGGGGSKEKPAEVEADKDTAKAEARAKTARSTAEAVGLAASDADALRKAADGEGGELPAGLVKLGLVGEDGLTTDAGRRALGALERGDKAGYQAALQDVRTARQRETDRAKARADREAAAAERERERQAASGAKEKEKADAEAQELDELAEDFQAGRRGLSYKEQRRLIKAGKAKWKPDGSLEFVKTVDVRAWRWAVKAEDDSHTPPAAVQAAARRALERRAKAPPSGRGMTAVGLARARDLSNGSPVSTATARRMVNYFTRHQKDKQGRTWPQYGKGRQAWDGWGGDAGWRWARGIVRRADTEGR